MGAENTTISTIFIPVYYTWKGVGFYLVGLGGQNGNRNMFVIITAYDTSTVLKPNGFSLLENDRIIYADQSGSYIKLENWLMGHPWKNKKY